MPKRYMANAIYIYKFTSKCHSLTTTSRSHQGQETFLAPSVDNQTRNYDT